MSENIKNISDTASDTPFIKVENLSYSYENDGVPSEPALRDISLEIREGEYVAVLGHNGSGKSTFAKLLNMILTTDKGKIIIDGTEITSSSMTDDDMFEVRRKVGMVFQNPDNQLVATIVEEDVAFGPENLGLPRDEIRKRVYSSLDMVGMRDYSKHAPHKLSGGQKQRVAIAGIIAMRPRCIIFDESTAMLDPLGRKEVMSIIKRLNRDEGITVIQITHYMEEAAMADRVIIINDGTIAADSTPRDIFSRVDFLKSVGLEAPQGTELIWELRKDGFDLPDNCVTDEECIAALSELFEKTLKGKKDEQA